jgi:hypothetical protein
MLAIIFLVVILSWSFYSASTKAESLRPQKQFSEAFFEGCDWIRKNTPKDSLIYTLWGHRAYYHCKRDPIGNNKPGINDALLLQNESAYDIFKRHGVDYLYIQKFSIKQGQEKVSYPLDFIRYIETSPHYRKVYQYPQNCLYNQNIADCVAVYKMVEGGNQEQQSINISDQLQ